MASSPPPQRGRRTWSILVGMLVVLFLLIIAFGMLSEREDARVLPPGEMEGREQTTP